MTKAQLLQRADEIRRKIREIEAVEKSQQRRRRNRAAYIVGGWILRHQPEDARRLLPKLYEKDRELVSALLPALTEAPKVHHVSDRERPEL